MKAQYYSRLTPYERRDLRNQYVEAQKGLCYWCKSDIHSDPPKKITDFKINWNLFPEGFLNYPIHLQHNHATDLTEGAVHAYCNAVMWQYFKR